MVDKPTPQEIEYEKKQFLLALLDRRLQLLSTLCQPHTFSAFRSEADELVKNIMATVNVSDDLSGRTETTVATPCETVPPRPDIKCELNLVITDREAHAIRAALPEDIPVRQEVYNESLNLVSMLIGAYGTKGRTLVHTKLHALITEGVVRFNNNDHIEMSEHRQYMSSKAHFSIKATNRLDAEHKD